MKSTVAGKQTLEKCKCQEKCYADLSNFDRTMD